MPFTDLPIADLVTHYGYAAVLVGSLLEGETVLLLAGLAASNGHLSFTIVVLLAFCGGTIGDQVLFLLGRRYGSAMLARSPSLATRAEPVKRLIERHQAGLIVGVRFMYGLRLIGPFVIGMSEVRMRKFAVLNMLGAALWAPLIVGIGFVFGQTLSWLIADLGMYEAVALVVVIGAAGFWYWRFGRPARAARKMRAAQQSKPTTTNP